MMRQTLAYGNISLSTWTRCLIIVLFATLTGAAGAGEGSLKLRVTERGQLVPARVHLVGPGGEAVRAPGLPFFRDHFNLDGEVMLKLEDGVYRYTVERGPEYRRVQGRVEITAGEESRRNVAIERIVDLSQRGWWSGDLHIHRPLEDVGLLMRSEDLHVGPVLTVWNQRNLWRERNLPGELAVAVEKDRWMHVLSCEDERGGGALRWRTYAHPRQIARLCYSCVPLDQTNRGSTVCDRSEPPPSKLCNGLELNSQ